MDVHHNNIRKMIIDTAYNSKKACHVGSSLSLVEILTALFETKDSCDEIILSKGHGALCWYCALCEFNLINKDELKTFSQNDSDLSVLAVKNKRLGLRCSTGSLGQGLPIAVGMAIAMKRKNLKGNIYVIVGNGETNEGSIWEAAMLARQNKLNNLCVIIDHNKFQSDGKSSNIIELDNMDLLWSANGFETKNVNGHDVETIKNEISNFASSNSMGALICHTIKGYGISFMENSDEWHHNRMTDAQYKQAIDELDRRNKI